MCFCSVLWREFDFEMLWPADYSFFRFSIHLFCGATFSLTTPKLMAPSHVFSQFWLKMHLSCLDSNFIAYLC